jgi:hypothetical protein
MIDIETLGIKANCTILSIAAVKFNLHNKDLMGQHYYEVIDMHQPSRYIEQNTFMWWMQQTAEARNNWLMCNSKIKLHEALAKLYTYVVEAKIEYKEVTLWCRGANFDFVILQNAYEQLNLPLPWSHRMLADVRTFDAIVPKSILTDLAKVGVAHNALDDCYFQINYVQACMQYFSAKTER